MSLVHLVWLVYLVYLAHLTRNVQRTYMMELAAEVLEEVGEVLSTLS